jgi:hypothetical protein
MTIHDSHLGKFQTYSGCEIDFNAPDKQNILLEDIAHSLAHICRFNGHISKFYSVAQHSVLVTYLAPEELHKAAILHDAAEAYLGDVISPLKNLLGKPYTDLECKFLKAVADKWDINYSDFERIKPYDRMALEIEDAYFNQGNGSLFIRDFHRISDSLIGVLHQVWSVETSRQLYSQVAKTTLKEENAFRNLPYHLR